MNCTVEESKNHRTTSDEYKRIIEMYRNGMKRRQISDMVDVSYEMVCRIIRKAKKLNEV